MKLSDFDYNLPKELIAQYPATSRDASRLLVLDKMSGVMAHRNFKDIVDYFKNGDLLVLNDTKVIPARIFGRRLTGGKVEALLLRQKDSRRFSALLRPGRLKLGETIIFDHGSLNACLIARDEIEFDTDNLEKIYSFGIMPLPPYIKREADKQDNYRYQTVYAKNMGAVASPTAGLHFTEALITAIKSKGVDIAFVTLHVGQATFKPVKEEDVTRHKMGSECYEASKEAYSKIKQAKKESRRVIAVGTTSCRVLESLDYSKDSGSLAGETDIFIYPGYEFKVVDALITNFHLPRTTLLMLVNAFAGRAKITCAYQEAVKLRYRFYSYGDAMLII